MINHFHRSSKNRFYDTVVSCHKYYFCPSLDMSLWNGSTELFHLRSIINSRFICGICIPDAKRRVMSPKIFSTSPYLVYIPSVLIITLACTMHSLVHKQVISMQRRWSARMFIYRKHHRKVNDRITYTDILYIYIIVHYIINEMCMYFRAICLMKFIPLPVQFIKSKVPEIWRSNLGLQSFT